MANLSNFAENKIATWLAGGVAPTQLTTVFLDVHNGDPGETSTPNGTSVYQTLTGTAGRKSLSASSTFAVIDNSIVQNSIEILLTSSASANCTISYFSIWDANTNGNLLYWGAITNSPINVIATNRVSFAPNSIQITAA